MPPRGIDFLDPEPDRSGTPGRRDLALVVGLVEPVDPALVDRPVRVDSWPEFQRRFHWAGRPAIGHSGTLTTDCGAAVRAFFAHGGQAAWIVGMGAPPPAGSNDSLRIQALERLLYGQAGRWAAATARRQLLNTWLPPLGGDGEAPASWRGLGHLHGLEQVALVLLPDLPSLTAAAQATPVAPVRVWPEVFVPCRHEPAPRPVVPPAAAPRHDEDGIALWTRLAGAVAAFIRSVRRTSHFIAAAPLFDANHRTAAADPARVLLGTVLDRSLDTGGLASAFVQLAWPWLGGVLAEDLPGGLMPGDGVLAGLLARNASGVGTWHSARGSAVRCQTLEPALDLAQRRALAGRICLFENGPGGPHLGSDTTTWMPERAEPTADPLGWYWRPGPVSRLMSAVLRLAELRGQEIAFAPNGEATWRQVRERLSEALESLHRIGALAGPEPFSVACDRSTMDQNDVDAGRLIARIQVQPVFPVEAMRILLIGPLGALSASGDPA